MRVLTGHLFLKKDAVRKSPELIPSENLCKRTNQFQFREPTSFDFTNFAFNSGYICIQNYPKVYWWLQKACGTFKQILLVFLNQCILLIQPLRISKKTQVNTTFLLLVTFIQTLCDVKQMKTYILTLQKGLMFAWLFKCRENLKKLKEFK